MAENVLTNAAHATKLQKKLEEGKIEAAVSKKEREAAAMVQVGGKGKRKGKKQKAAVEYEDAFNIDLVVVKKFALLGVSAPVVPEDLQALRAPGVPPARSRARSVDGEAVRVF